MLRKAILGIAAFALVSVGVVQAAGVGILEASEQAGFSITCPEGVANCSSAATESTDYSVTGTQNFILKVVGGFLNFAAIIAVLMLVVAGLRLVLAMGNQESLQAAKKHVIWTIGGLAVIILSLLIVKNVTETVYKATLGCPTLVEDGIWGPKTKTASEKTLNLANQWCQESWKKDSTKEELVLHFQKKYNGLGCDREILERKDIPAGDAAKKKCQIVEKCKEDKPPSIASNSFNPRLLKAATAETGDQSSAVVTETRYTKDCRAVCKPEVPELPTSCYIGDTNKAQSKNTSVNCDEEMEKLGKVCTQMGISDCAVTNVQTAVKDFYEDPTAGCAKADGLYGQCTKEAILNYFAKKDCKGSTTTIASKDSVADDQIAAVGSPEVDSTSASADAENPAASKSVTDAASTVSKSHYVTSIGFKSVDCSDGKKYSTAKECTSAAISTDGSVSNTGSSTSNQLVNAGAPANNTTNNGAASTTEDSATTDGDSSMFDKFVGMFSGSN